MQSKGLFDCLKEKRIFTLGSCTSSISIFDYELQDDNLCDLQSLIKWDWKMQASSIIRKYMYVGLGVPTTWPIPPPLLQHRMSLHKGLRPKRTMKIEWSYWLRAWLWTQGVYTRIRVQGMKMWVGTNVASLSWWISAQECTPLTLRNQYSSLGPVWNPR